MLDEVKAWGLKPETVTGDSWYAAKETMNREHLTYAISNYT
jgi:hypothetical protein